MSFHKITSAISMLLTVMLICSCDRDLNEGVDYYSPQAEIPLKWHGEKMWK